jgi:hypothetical protein
MSSRERLLSERQRTAALRQLFPDIAQLRIELVFSSPTGQAPAPSPQLYTLFAAAAAFFRYPCPCADCDGDFNLTEAVTALNAGKASRRRAGSITGQLACQGTQFRNHASLQAGCAMQVSYTIHSQPVRATDSQAASA